jgi:hypothetical protein
VESQQPQFRRRSARSMGRADEGQPEPVGGNAPIPSPDDTTSPAPVEQVPSGEALAAGHA